MEFCTNFFVILYLTLPKQIDAGYVDWYLDGVPVKKSGAASSASERERATYIDEAKENRTRRSNFVYQKI
jgi:hypothetical protein